MSLGGNGSTTTSCARTVATAMRMLDNVIDINYYTIAEARSSNLRHRPVGLGIMGFQDACRACAFPTPRRRRSTSPTRAWRRSASTPISASVDLAAERGRYPAFEGSLWSTGHPAAGHASTCLPTRAAATSTSTARARLDWDGAARARQTSRHAQFQRDGDRADGDDLQHHRRLASRSSPPTRTSTSSRTCRASSPSSTPTWCAT